jgi:pSer/pThr/pTyr-binding forkhead associated (FHA) protein
LHPKTPFRDFGTRSDAPCFTCGELDPVAGMSNTYLERAAKTSMSENARRPSPGGDTRGPTRVRLRYREQDLLLAPGQYVLGRSSACHIVIDHGLVSRRHAVVEVTATGASLRDLGSVNGVMVNGTRIGDKPQPLNDGDRISVGEESIEVRLEDVKPGEASGRENRDTRPTLDGDLPAAPARATRAPAGSSEDSEVGMISVQSTQRADALELVSIVANKALAAGRVREAENMLRLHLKAVLQDHKNKRPHTPEAQAAAATLALKLARATLDSRWFDYVLELLLGQIALPSETLLGDLEVTLAKLPLVSSGRLEQYAQAIRGLPASYEKLRRLQRIDALVQLANTKRR